jgi:hypothetical protein
VQKLSAPNFCAFKNLLYLCVQKFNDNKKAFLLIFSYMKLGHFHNSSLKRKAENAHEYIVGFSYFSEWVIAEPQITIR